MPKKIRIKQLNTQELYESINDKFNILTPDGKNRIDDLSDKVIELVETIDDIKEDIENGGNNGSVDLTEVNEKIDSLEERVTIIEGNQIITVKSLLDRDNIDPSTLKENSLVRVSTDTADNYFFWDTSFDPPRWTEVDLICDGDGETPVPDEIEINDVKNLENTISWSSI